MKAGVLSACDNKYNQAVCTQYGWSRMHPMVKKADTHEALSLVFKRDGVPPQMVVDNSKEKNLGRFSKKYCKADCRLVTTEPYSP